MKILPNGFFSFNYNAEQLSKGLRPFAEMPRNNKFLTRCDGAVGRNGVLKTLTSLSLHTATVEHADIVWDDFPFPQLFVLEKLILLCNRQSILEYDGAAFVEKVSGITSGSKWNVASAWDFVYLSNGKVAIVRNPTNRAYGYSSNAPVNTAALNFNGQIIVGISS